MDSIEERPLYVTRVEVGGESRRWWKRIDLRKIVCNVASRPSPEDRRMIAMRVMGWWRDEKVLLCEGSGIE